MALIWHRVWHVARLSICDQLVPCVPCGSDIAIALHTPPHRAVSLLLVAQALGATRRKGRLICGALTASSIGLAKGSRSSRKVLNAVNAIEQCL